MLPSRVFYILCGACLEVALPRWSGTGLVRAGVAAACVDGVGVGVGRDGASSADRDGRRYGGRRSGTAGARWTSST